MSSSYGMFTRDVLYTSNGIRKTRSLFKEYCLSTDTPVFTVTGNDPSYINIKELYIKLCTEDPSEATFAETVFGDVIFWKNIAKCNWIEEDLEEWKEAAEVRRKALAFKSVMDEVRNEGRSSFSAAKFLIEEPWKKGKTERKQSRKTTDKAKSIYNEDFKRLEEQGYLDS